MSFEREWRFSVPFARHRLAVIILIVFALILTLILPLAELLNSSSRINNSNNNNSSSNSINQQIGVGYLKKLPPKIFKLHHQNYPNLIKPRQHQQQQQQQQKPQQPQQLMQKSKIRRKIAVNPKNTLECHRREYTFKAVNTDEATGKRCAGYITVESCWGRCNSGEIADYHFPFKKSFHFVCMHGDSKRSVYELADCDSGAPRYLRLYEATVAKTCVCRMCDTSQTNCESFPAMYS